MGIVSYKTGLEKYQRGTDKIMLKILYIFTAASERGSSVQTKVMNQIRFLNESGTFCKGAFFVSKDNFQLPGINSQIELIPYKRSDRRFFPTRETRKNQDQAILCYLNNTVTDFDIIYLRYPLANKTFYQIALLYGNKMVIEHQSKDIPELWAQVRFEKFRFKLGYLLFLYEYGLRRLITESFYGRRVLKKVLGGVAVTREVAAYTKSRFTNYRCEVVGNAIDFSRFKMPDKVAFDGKTVNFFVLIGANTISPTHGIDRLIDSVKLNNSGLFIRLSIFSKNKYENARGENYEIIYEGYRTGEELDTKLSQMHFAIGGLASFRKQVFFGSGLKVREYFARGVPIIMASFDEDIESDEEAKRYVIQVPNEEKPVDFRRIESRIREILQDEDRTLKIRKAGERLFSFPAKMRMLAEKIENFKQ
jgi:hypothetical protein